MRSTSGSVSTLASSLGSRRKRADESATKPFSSVRSTARSIRRRTLCSSVQQARARSISGATGCHVAARRLRSALGITARHGASRCSACCMNPIALNRHIERAGAMREQHATVRGDRCWDDAAHGREEESRRAFVPGREIATYRDEDELVERVNHYLEHDDERKRGRASGTGADTARAHIRHRMQELARDPARLGHDRPRAPRVACDGRNVLITGGLGFLGSNLARELVEAGAERRARRLARSRVRRQPREHRRHRGPRNVNISDVRDQHSLRSSCAGRTCSSTSPGQTSHLDSMTDPYTDLEINCRAPALDPRGLPAREPRREDRLREHAADLRPAQYLPVDERHPIVPVDVNGINKAAGEWYHLLYGEVYGLHVSVLRLTNTYGPRMRVRDARQTFLGYWLRLLVDGSDPGLGRRDASGATSTIVDDAVRAFLLAAAGRGGRGGVQRRRATSSSSLIELAELLVALNGGEVVPVVPFPPDRKAIDIGDYYADCGKIRASSAGAAGGARGGARNGRSTTTASTASGTGETSRSSTSRGTRRRSAPSSTRRRGRPRPRPVRARRRARASSRRRSPRWCGAATRWASPTEPTRSRSRCRRSASAAATR